MSDEYEYEVLELGPLLNPPIEFTGDQLLKLIGETSTFYVEGRRFRVTKIKPVKAQEETT